MYIVLFLLCLKYIKNKCIFQELHGRRRSEAPDSAPGGECLDSQTLHTFKTTFHENFVKKLLFAVYYI